MCGSPITLGHESKIALESATKIKCMDYWFVLFAQYCIVEVFALILTVLVYRHFVTYVLGKRFDGFNLYLNFHNCNS